MTRKSKSKKKVQEYDENGHWVQERNRIKGAVRRVFRLFPQMKDVLKEARVELPPLIKKNGEPGKRPQVRYRCAECGELFSRNNVQVDHIVPVVPLHKKEVDMTYDEIVRGICCNVENLQVVCSTPLKRSGGIPSCHKIKTEEENFCRKKLSELPYYLGYLEGREYQVVLAEAKEEFKVHLVKKEKERLAKEQRKIEREKKKAERLARIAEKEK